MRFQPLGPSLSKTQIALSMIALNSMQGRRAAFGVVPWPMGTHLVSTAIIVHRIICMYRRGRLVSIGLIIGFSVCLITSLVFAGLSGKVVDSQ